jgi:hypothetical protein
MVPYREVEVELHHFLISALGGGEGLASCSGRFTSDVRAPDDPLESRWVDFSAGLTVLWKEKCLVPNEMESRVLVGQPVT